MAFYLDGQIVESRHLAQALENLEATASTCEIIVLVAVDPITNSFWFETIVSRSW